MAEPRKRGGRRRRAAAGRDVARPWRAALDQVPRDTRTHAVGACREMLLVLRSLLDAAMRALEAPRPEAPARRIRIK